MADGQRGIEQRGIGHRAAGWLLAAAAAGLVAMTAIIGWQVFGRFVLSSSPTWAEQLALVMMIWLVFLGAAAGVYEGFHIRITMLEQAMPLPARRRVRLLANILVALAGLAMAIWGTELVLRTWSHAIPSLGIPRGAAYAPLPVSGALIILFALQRAASDWRAR